MPAVPNLTLLQTPVDAADADGDLKRTLATRTYLQLRQEIIGGEFEPGTKLKIRDLCLRYDAGLSPIREALSRLSTEGLVVQHDQRGFSVAPVDETSLLDLTRARLWVTEVGLRQSIAHGDAGWEEALVVAHHRLLRTPRTPPDDPTRRTAEWTQAHLRFHRALVAASGSAWITAFCDQLFEATERYRHLSRSRTRSRDSVDAEHKAIMEAALARDADGAVGLMNRHLERTSSLALAALRERQGGAVG